MDETHLSKPNGDALGSAGTFEGVSTRLAAPDNQQRQQGFLAGERPEVDRLGKLSEQHVSIMVALDYLRERCGGLQGHGQNERKS